MWNKLVKVHSLEVIDLHGVNVTANVACRDDRQYSIDDNIVSYTGLNSYALYRIGHWMHTFIPYNVNWGRIIISHPV